MLTAFVERESSISLSYCFKFLRLGLKRRGWIFAETPFSAIPPAPTVAPSQPK